MLGTGRRVIDRWPDGLSQSSISTDGSVVPAAMQTRRRQAKRDSAAEDMITEPVMTAMTTTSIPGVLLAGGLAQRMGGGDKPMRLVDGRTILQRVMERLAPQCSRLILNANGDPARFASTSLPVVADSVDGFKGPLAGILAGLDWVASHMPETQWMLSAAADCPFLPRDLVARLVAARAAEHSELALAASGGQLHPVVGLWPVGLRADLRHALVTDDIRKVTRFTARYAVATVSWPVVPLDPFFNANTADDLAEAERLAALDD